MIKIHDVLVHKSNPNLGNYLFNSKGKTDVMKKFGVYSLSCSQCNATYMLVKLEDHSKLDTNAKTEFLHFKLVVVVVVLFRKFISN